MLMFLFKVGFLSQLWSLVCLSSVWREFQWLGHVLFWAHASSDPRGCWQLFLGKRSCHGTIHACVFGFGYNCTPPEFISYGSHNGNHPTKKPHSWCGEGIAAVEVSQQSVFRSIHPVLCNAFPQGSHWRPSRLPPAQVSGTNQHLVPVSPCLEQDLCWAHDPIQSVYHSDTSSSSGFNSIHLFKKSEGFVHQFLKNKLWLQLVIYLNTMLQKNSIDFWPVTVLCLPKAPQYWCMILSKAQALCIGLWPKKNTQHFWEGAKNTW